MRFIFYPILFFFFFFYPSLIVIQALCQVSQKHFSQCVANIISDIYRGWEVILVLESVFPSFIHLLHTFMLPVPLSPPVPCCPPPSVSSCCLRPWCRCPASSRSPVSCQYLPVDSEHYKNLLITKGQCCYTSYMPMPIHTVIIQLTKFSSFKTCRTSNKAVLFFLLFFRAIVISSAETCTWLDNLCN